LCNRNLVKQIEFFKIPNFKFSGALRDSRGGGVGVYVRDGIGVVLVPVVTIFGCDVHSIRLECDGSFLPVVLTVIYRQPSADVTEFFE